MEDAGRIIRVSLKPKIIEHPPDDHAFPFLASELGIDVNGIRFHSGVRVGPVNKEDLPGLRIPDNLVGFVLIDGGKKR